MSTAVMNSNSIYEFGELLLKQQQQQKSVLGSNNSNKMRWEDQGHEPLSRRASHPVGPTMASLVTTLLLDNLNSHRRLDRSQSDPAKSIINVNTSRYKTELCRPFEESGECKYGDKCQFAHGGHELRNLVRHPKYKTELCRTFHTVGFCPYGPRCHFIHNAEEARAMQMKNRPRPLCLLPGPGSSADTPSPPSSLGSVSPPPSSTSNTAFSFASLVHESPRSLSPCHSPPPPPASPDARLPVFNRLSQPGILAFQFGGELIA
ncbi:protein TIS11 isoform X1 [Homalodisca vitripennis]|nr:protein TIS11 isoform X1 [Homalodisca vitripennis]